MNEIDICNLALSLLGARPILNFEDAEKGARMGFLYPNARDYVLSRHEWSAAISYAKLVSRTNAATKWAYAYDLPVDPFCIRVVKMVRPRSVRYEKAGGKLLTDADLPVIKFIARVTDPTILGPGLQQLIAARLSSQMAMQISNNPRLALEMAANFEREFNMERARDIDEAYPNMEESEKWDERFETTFDQDISRKAGDPAPIETDHDDSLLIYTGGNP